MQYSEMRRCTLRFLDMAYQASSFEIFSIFIVVTLMSLGCICKNLSQVK